MNFFFLDEDWEVEVLKNVLEARHPEHQFELADTLVAGKTLIWSKKFDVLVLDVMIPADDEAVPNSSNKAGLLSGLLLTDLIRKDQSCKNNRTPIVLLTGLIPAEHPKVLEAQTSFGAKFIRKPVHPDDIFRILMHVVEAGVK